MFDALQKRLSTALSKVRGRTRIDEALVDEVLTEIRTGLLEADVHFRVTKDFLARVRSRVLSSEVMQSVSPESQILKILSDELTQVFGSKNRELNFQAQPPAVILMCGLQGSGKTTTTVKLATHIQEALKKSVCVVSVDVYRPAAIEQLKQVSTKAGVKCLESLPSEKPRQIAERALKQAHEQNFQVLLVDTAGRLQLDDELMNELQDLHKILKPTETLLVLDAMMGQQAVDVAEGFDRKIGLTGSVLSKLDGDTRGGAALSLVAVTGKPIKFVGTGERYTDLEPFYPDRMASRLLDMGDVLSLIEKAQRVITEEEALKTSEKLNTSNFTLEDFKEQLKMISRMGSLGNIMKMLPGMGALKDQIDSVDTEKEVKRVQAILDSMTRFERKNPDVLDASRKARVAKGSGVQVSEVNSLLKRFLEAKKMMKNMGKMSKFFQNPKGAGMPPFMGGGGNRRGFGRKF